MVIMSEAINSACYTHESDPRSVKMMHRAFAVPEPMESVDWLRYDAFYNMRRQSQFEKTNHYMFGTSNMDNFCNPLEKMINRSSYHYKFRSML